MKYEDKSGNRLMLDTFGEDYALEEAIIRDDLFHTQYTNGTMSESGYLEQKNNIWRQYEEKKRQEEQRANEERNRRNDEIASWEGPAGRIARLAYEQALRDGRSEAEAYYYAIRIKKICDELSEDDADAVLQDIELNHQNNFLEYFLMDKDVYAVNDTEGDPNRGDKMTVQKTDFEYFMLRHLKNDFRMEDMGKLFWALGEFSKTMYMFIAGMITFNALLAYATRIVEYMNVQNYVNNMDSNLTVTQQQTIRENVLKSIEESKKISDASNFDKHIQRDKELAEKIAQENTSTYVYQPLSDGNIKHIIKHTIQSLKQQLPYLSETQLEATLKKNSYFNPKWTNEEVIKYSEIAYNDLLSQGITGNKIPYVINGETLLVSIHWDGRFGTIHGTYKYTLEEFRNLIGEM